MIIRLNKTNSRKQERKYSASCASCDKPESILHASRHTHTNKELERIFVPHLKWTKTEEKTYKRERGSGVRRCEYYVFVQARVFYAL